MRSARAVTLRLSDLDDVNQRGDVILARDFRRAEVGLDQRGIIPAAHGVMIEAALILSVAFKAFERGADIFLDHLKLIRHGDAVTVVIDGDDGGRFEHADGVDAFPKHAFGCGGVADSRKRDFISIARKIFERLERVQLAI